MKALLRYKAEIAEIDLGDMEKPPSVLSIPLVKPEKRMDVFALVCKADGMPYYHFMRSYNRP